MVISPIVSSFPSRMPPLMTRGELVLAKSRRLFAVATGSPLMKAIADGPVSRSSKPSTPASFAAIFVSVFFTTA